MPHVIKVGRTEGIKHLLHDNLGLFHDLHLRHFDNLGLLHDLHLWLLHNLHLWLLHHLGLL